MIDCMECCMDYQWPICHIHGMDIRDKAYCMGHFGAFWGIPILSSPSHGTVGWDEYVYTLSVPTMDSMVLPSPTGHLLAMLDNTPSCSLFLGGSRVTGCESRDHFAHFELLLLQQHVLLQLTCNLN